MKTTKLGEIKIESLKLMFADYKNDYSVDTLDDLLSDDNYGKYLRAMNGSINRCFDRIRSLRKQPKKALEIDKGESTESLLFINLDDALYQDVDYISRITYRDDYGYQSKSEYEIEGRTLIIPNRDGVYRMVYYEKLPFITTETDTDIIQIEDELARLIPYFIKYELIEEDEPDQSRAAKMEFETMLARLYQESDIVQTKVVDVWEGEF